MVTSHLGRETRDMVISLQELFERRGGRGTDHGTELADGPPGPARVPAGYVGSDGERAVSSRACPHPAEWRQPSRASNRE
jgi:hypothetical protein